MFLFKDLHTRNAYRGRHGCIPDGTLVVKIDRAHTNKGKTTEAGIRFLIQSINVVYLVVMLSGDQARSVCRSPRCEF